MNDRLIRFRRDRAKETLADARMLMRDGGPRSRTSPSTLKPAAYFS